MDRFPCAVALSALAALVFACEQAPPGSGSPGSEPPQAAAPDRKPASIEIGGVVWPPAEQIDRAARDALPAKARAVIDVSQVPVLVPPRPALLAAATLIAKEHWTSFSARTPETTVSIRATRLARRYDHVAPARGPRSVRGLPAFVMENEGIWSVTWMENGVSYSIDLECASADNAACATEAPLLELARELVYVGGAGSGGAR